MEWLLNPALVVIASIVMISVAAYVSWRNRNAGLWAPVVPETSEASIPSSISNLVCYKSGRGQRWLFNNGLGTQRIKFGEAVGRTSDGKQLVIKRTARDGQPLTLRRSIANVIPETPVCRAQAA